MSATHIVADLPPGLGADRWSWLVEEWVYRNLIDKGMIVDWAVHHRAASDGRQAGQPHVHLLAMSRFWRAGGRQGSRHGLANADQIRAAEDAWLHLLRVTPGAGIAACLGGGRSLSKGTANVLLLSRSSSPR